MNTTTRPMADTLTPDPHHGPGVRALPPPTPITGSISMPGQDARRLLADHLGAVPVHHDAPAIHPASSTATALARAARPDYGRWLEHVRAVGECTHPIRLAGTSDTINPATGEVLASFTTRDTPDGVIYKACGNRRAAVCPSCAETYRADTYQLIGAGITGGKNVPASVRTHPFAFLTLTAPSFGLVHTTRAKNGRPRPCRPRRDPLTCPHGVALACHATHHDGERLLGKPLCLDCYGHDHQVVWNVMASELWRRTTDTLKKRLARHGARASFGKVAEMQARGVVHFHAIIRLDHADPDLRVNDLGDLAEVPAPPPSGVTTDLLARLLGEIIPATAFTSPSHADRPGGWLIEWGPQFDVRPVQATVRHEIGTGPIAETAVAGYLAKYATKATEQAGHVSARITGETIGDHTDPDTHVGRLIDACWRLGRNGADHNPNPDANGGRLAYARLRRWAHMLGFGGHFSTKSRRYSTTLGALRQARITWRRNTITATHRLAEHLDAETTLLVGTFTYAGIGWHTTGDALLATTAAAKAREHHHTARQELAHETGRMHPSALRQSAA